MPGKYDDTLQKILVAATTEPRENLVNRLNAIVGETKDAVAPVIAMGAICYGKANTDNNLSPEEIAGLKGLCEIARKRGAQSQGTPEALLADGAATLFTITADQAAGKKLPAPEHHKVVLDARAKLDRADKGNNEPIFDILNAAAQRFFPVKIRENQTKDQAVNKLTGLARLTGAEGMLARLLLAEHMMRRGQAKGLNAIAQRLGEELPKAACVQTFKATAAMGAGNLGQAEECLAAAFQLNPKDRAIRKGYAQILRANGKPDKAKEIEAG